MTALTRASRASLKLAVTDLSTANRGGGRDKRAIRQKFTYPTVKDIRNKFLNCTNSLSNLLHKQGVNIAVKRHILWRMKPTSAEMLLCCFLAVWQPGK